MGITDIFWLLVVAAYVITYIGMRRDIAERDRTISELLDRFVHNQAPPRIVEQKQKRAAMHYTSGTTITAAMMGDPVSVAERKAIEYSNRQLEIAQGRHLDPNIKAL